ncbi:DUF488 domain-containing protein [Parapusillimonas granuli]|uniref:DUF488 family protein n=1 Tax=Parapusillimonas granuli TaxID=380911 RepID=A0A853G6B4_9BURK|nr:DUF488 family protein [Parapusillimonas granuli]MBB5214218.1 uncharacterized protein YeaO (DUF488 family) [Parapusillimonas granuli]MEB2399045.1 DUF488 family protein [Alcaligenaceae bacterium]NYT51322.1 DUF488 family protein [Parapusillimonas granuli]
MPRQVQIKRVYDPPQRGDGYRVLIDRLWPRGVKKEELEHDAWIKDLAPSPGLRKWFGHKVEHWDRFRDGYQAELRAPEQQARMRDLIQAAGRKKITLLYAAKDDKHNHALILADELNRLY